MDKTDSLCSEIKLDIFERPQSVCSYNSVSTYLTFIGVWTQKPWEFWLLWGRAIYQPGSGFFILVLVLSVP